MTDAKATSDVLTNHTILTKAEDVIVMVVAVMRAEHGFMETEHEDDLLSALEMVRTVRLSLSRTLLEGGKF